MKRMIPLTPLLLLFALLVLTSASRPAFAGEPCCDIVSIGRVNGIVTARDLQTGETFKFEVDSRSLLKTMRVGQKVWKQAGGTKVGILEISPCCEIVGKGNASPGVHDKAHKDEIDVLSIDGKGNASPGVSTSPATATSGGRTDPGRTLVSSRVPWEIKPSADMKGATGQIVIQFPGMEQAGNNFTAIFEIGGKDRISTASYGNKNFPLQEGEYDVEINSVRVTRVPVTPGMDTRIHIGTVSFNVPSNVSVKVYDITKKKRLCLSYGPMKCGVPPGEYYVKIGGSSKKVTIADGQVIDF